MDRQGIMGKLKTSGPGLLAMIGIMVGVSPWISGSLYRNMFLGAGLTLLFLSWVYATLKNKKTFLQQNRWNDQKKAMVVMSLCAGLGLGLLTYYEMQMPKYQIAKVDKELYRVPPQLNQKQLRELGAECNTYGNTLCSHDVFAKIVKQDPRDYFALANLAMAQSHLGFHEFAVVNFKQAIDKGVKRFDTYKFYGHSLMAIGKKDLALQAYRASLKKNPNQPALQDKINQLQ